MAPRNKRQRRRSRRRLTTQTLESRMMLHAAGIVSGAVFFDSDGDTTRDAGETGVPGIVVELSSADQAVQRSTITDDQGDYLFDELLPGDYRLTKRTASATAEDAAAALIDLTLTDDQNLGGQHFVEAGLEPEFINVAWFFASAPSEPALLRESIALGEQLHGEPDLAAAIRAGASDVPVNVNNPPIASNNSFSVDENDVLPVAANAGVLANDTDADGDPLTAVLVHQASNGVVVLADDGSFTYTPNNSFSGSDSFTYRANDGSLNSNLATVTISVVPQGSNHSPIAVNDSHSVAENDTLSIDADAGVLTNDTDADGDSLTATVVAQPTNGSLTLETDGSFTYEPEAEFFGNDSFTYTASDGTATSNVATVSIQVTPIDSGTPFGQVTVGAFTDAGLRGIRTDLVSGAPAITANHVSGDVDYSAHSNPPTYGDHHPFDPDGTDADPGITPRPTGIYTTEQPDEDLVHNLEHGHVWISYNPNLLGAADVAALQQLVRDGVGNANGSGVGVILTPRAANDQAIALASWAHLLTLDTFDPDQIRDFIETNRGKAPEGFITP